MRPGKIFNGHQRWMCEPEPCTWYTVHCTCQYPRMGDPTKKNVCDPPGEEIVCAIDSLSPLLPQNTRAQTRIDHWEVDEQIHFFTPPKNSLIRTFIHVCSTAWFAYGEIGVARFLALKCQKDSIGALGSQTIFFFRQKAATFGLLHVANTAVSGKLSYEGLRITPATGLT